MKKDCPFTTEAEMVACWLDQLRHVMDQRKAQDWTIYPETAGWDILLVHREGFQLGIEAKLSLNAKVLSQALAGQHYAEAAGPDYRAVLVPSGSCQLHMAAIADAIGIRILRVRPWERGSWYELGLPDEGDFQWREWPCWLPERRCALPDYVPDVSAGHKSPVMLTPWKIKAIRLMILLERRGRVSRGDMKALGISPTRWTDHWNGFLSPSRELGGYVRNERTPDLKAQHPTNWAEIEADFEKWCPPGYRFEAEAAA